MTPWRHKNFLQKIKEAIDGRAGFLCDRRRIDNGSMNGRNRKGKKKRDEYIKQSSE